jgi:hypothetical protein
LLSGGQVLITPYPVNAILAHLSCCRTVTLVQPRVLHLNPTAALMLAREATPGEQVPA